MLDSLGVEVFTIEMQLGGDIVKADIMREPVAFTKIATDRILQPSEALASSLNFYGKVEMDYIMRSTGLSDEDVIAALQGEIFYNPVTDEWEHKGKFIAGNVIAKCTEFVSCIPDLSERQTQRPNRYLMKSWISIWASVGLTSSFTPTLRQNFSGWKPK